MFFVISKLLVFLISPFTWIIVLIFISIFSKNPKRKRKTLIASLLLILFFSNSFIFDEAMRAWELPTTQVTDVDSTYDAGIVLGGIMTYDMTFDRIKFGRRNDRLMQAIDLYRKGKIKKIFFTSGAGTILNHEIKEAPLVKRFAMELCIPDSDFIIECESDNTHENAAFSKPILKKHFGDGKFLLITSAFHMRRSLGCFREEGIRVTPYCADKISGPRKFVPDHLILPNLETLLLWESLIHEITGFWTYRIFGYA